MKYTNCEETMKDVTFDCPKMVKFHVEGEDDSVTWGGIAFGKNIICGCCGGIFEFDDCDMVEILSWANISDEIKGE